MFALRTIGRIIRASGLASVAAAFAMLYVACSAALATFEPGLDGLGEALWYSFEVVTTIGFGELTATTAVGRAVTAILSVVSIFFMALLTGTVVTYCNEMMAARRDEGVSHLLDQLERLPELSRDELAEISRQVREHVS